ncbi:class I SAM-dependent RNA methyltransferase [Methyloceanibacter sp.]|uniref:class I SAM-dependent RNA methyltransferase n=1 Tax=Methyloceanibacter sp. TaxID=1965321 RepID=UPI002D6D6FC2|nr:class I SAM-dependent RNA methyltransferase [Methyloceanibacter sp.]HZP10679.1 class I SAM-dependent RNA methyltransferase [Methyloceanibacter sp.]
MAAEILEVEIARLGAGGDGVADGPGGPIYVPFTLSGERVVIALKPGENRGDLLEVVEPSRDRVAPVCRYFGACGGCALQHMEKDAYLAWKRDQVAAAFKARGLTVAIEPVLTVPLASRRRATLSLGRERQGPVLGYRRARSHDLIDVDACPVLVPVISARLARLKQALGSLLGVRREARVTLTETETGLDVLLEGARPSPVAIGAFAAEAAALSVARLTAGADSIALGGAPELDLSGARVKLPPGAFIQASREAETEMVALVLEGAGKAKRIADLFAGLGTFTFALARSSAVDAYEADGAALAQLAEAARRTPKLKPVRPFARDLFRAPLGVAELQAYGAVVFDPPRAGASAQATQLAKSPVPSLVAVSCNPGTLARDLRILVDGGYRITRVVPVDQFLFSPHIEVVAHLSR